MGEDIHFRMYLKRKSDGKYVNAHEVCEWNPRGTSFAEPFEGRNYDVFSLFGSGRGNYEPLPSINYGMPDFLQGGDFDSYCKACGFYGFVWFNVLELERDLEDFVQKLKDPCLFLDDSYDEYAEWKALRAPGRKTADEMRRLNESYAAWYDYHGVMIGMTETLLMNVKHFTHLYCQEQVKDHDASEPARISDSPYGKAFDMDETVFLFFFDS